VTPLEKRKLEMLREDFGPLSTEEAFNLALKAEEIKRQCGVGDPAFLHFAIEQQSLENLAVLLEKESMQ